MQSTWLQNEKTQIFYSALTFRRLLDSLAQPGKITQLDNPTFQGETPTVNPYALGAFQTLLDRETSAGMIAGGEWLAVENPLWTWLTVRSGVVWAAPDQAQFVLVCDGNSGGLLPKLSPGTLLEPENSATVFYSVDQLNAQPQPDALNLVLAGPGILGERRIGVKGLALAELKAIQATRRNYPLGLDIYLVDAAGRCAGLPRTTRISTQE